MWLIQHPSIIIYNLKYKNNSDKIGHIESMNNHLTMTGFGKITCHFKNTCIDDCLFSGIESGM